MHTKAESSLPMRLAPIILFCYNRPAHLRQTIASLRANPLASQSELIIFSDGPKTCADEQNVREVRAALREIDGFQDVWLVEADENQGLAESVIRGVSQTLASFGKVIVLEDDMLCTPDFLTFMNEALHAFEHRSDVFSVTAYSPPFPFPATYREDLYLAPRASSWGWGTWADRWAKADWEVLDFPDIKTDSAQKKAFQAGGEDLFPMLAKQQKGIIDSWAIRWTYCQFRNAAYGVYPVKSKIKNIGTDGSGTNFTFATAYYGNEMNPEPIRINPDIAPDPDVISAFRAYYNLPLYLKIKNRIRYNI